MSRRTSYSLLAVLIVVLLLLGSFSQTALPASAATEAATSSASGLSWVKFYFTDPAHTDEKDQNLADYVTGAVLPIINASSKTIDITSFDFNLPGIVDAVVKAKARGVVVRVVVDDKN